MYLKQPLFLCALILGSITAINADTLKNVELPVKRISLFSSGVGYFERAGEVTGLANLTLPFENAAMDDVLKSLIVHDPSTNAPIVSYSSDNLQKTLSSLKINLSSNPSIAQILASLKGAEIEIYAPNKITGKIIGVETKSVVKEGAAVQQEFLSIFTQNKIVLVSLQDIASYSFSDKTISQDLARALDVILNFRQNAKYVNVYLPSSKKRSVFVSYVIPVPVWKAAYRLDLDGKKPFLQGWAIVDNAGDSDWKDVELSLIVGRPTSFTQPLYTPYFLTRPVLPLSIAGFAQARSYDTGFAAAEEMFYESAAAPLSKMSAAKSDSGINRSVYDTTSSKSAGEHFAFTLKNPITLERRQSAMFPFAQGDIKARKVSIFTHIPQNTAVNPALGAEITNALGLKLPAGAISVYEGGSYAGDALTDFLADGEKRFISYGDDLTLLGTVSHSSSALFSSVKISKGVLAVTEKITYEKTYAIKNSGKADKNIILEHPFTYDAKLIQPSKYAEKTASSYRFEFVSPAGKELKYIVKEEKPNISYTRIADMDYAAVVLFSTNKNFSKEVKNALAEAAKLMSEVKTQKSRLEEVKRAHQDKLSEQDRIRQNIHTVGSESTVGKDYIKKLTALDDEIDKISETINKTAENLQKAQKEFDKYISDLEI
ncbi:MAG: hypothetical protein LBF71_05900 [Campylobacteraceae bacterium]|jgi:hypothetical protein|nr:hypothetical protein [Campylobacteraceae bacterium]